MLVSCVQQSGSVTHVSILFQIIFPFRLLQNIEQSSLCYTAGPCWLSILNIVVCTRQPQTPNLSPAQTLIELCYPGHGLSFPEYGYDRSLGC